jgi:hypothetical protein
MVAGVLLDKTQNCEAVTSHDLAESIGFLESVDAEVEQSIKDRPVVKKTGLIREPEKVREGLVLERTSLLSTLVGLGAFDGLVSDENGNPVSFTSRIGIHGGFARVGDLPPKTEKKEGEKKGKNPDAWKKVPAEFVASMKRNLERLFATNKSVDRDALVLAMKEEAGINTDKFLREGLYDKWRVWASLTRESNPALRDSKDRPIYISKQGRTGGFVIATYPEETPVVAETTAETVADESESSDLSEVVSDEADSASETDEAPEDAEFVEVTDSDSTESV